jgi:hypothetical protein
MNLDAAAIRTEQHQTRRDVRDDILKQRRQAGKHGSNVQRLGNRREQLLQLVALSTALLLERPEVLVLDRERQQLNGWFEGDLAWTKVSLLFYGLLAGGTAKLAVLALFGLFGVSEAHHVVEALATGGYEAGVVTSIPYAAIGYLMVAEVWREFRRGATAAHTAARFA